MKQLSLFLFLVHLCFCATAAKKKDHWINVETTPAQKEGEKGSPYPYDSLEGDITPQTFKEVGFWSLAPKLVLSGGFHGDRMAFEKDAKNRWFGGPALQFRTHPWHRLKLSANWVQNNSMFVTGSWEYTPSRKRLRAYYGAGLALQLISQQEIGNLVQKERYYLTAHSGLEYLLRSGHGLMVELKGYGGFENYALEASLGYIIPL